MQDFLNIFGDITIKTIVSWIVCGLFLFKVFGVVKSYYHKRWISQKEQEDRTKKVFEQVEKYPDWRKQSIDKQDMFTQAIEKLDEKMDNFIENITAQLAEISKKSNEGMAYTWRYRILRFNDEILHSERHTKEHFDQILEDIRKYEIYCKENPDFPNNKAVFSIQNIKHTYAKCSEEGDFL